MSKALLDAVRSLDSFWSLEFSSWSSRWSSFCVVLGRVLGRVLPKVPVEFLV